MLTTSKWLGMLAVAFIAGSFVASPELRAFAANTVRSIDIVDGEVKTADLANNAVTAAKVKDGEIKAAEIATDAVGAAELQGVTKLLFAECSTSDFIGYTISAGGILGGDCKISGVDANDSIIATKNGSANYCFDVVGGIPSNGAAMIELRNNCSVNRTFASGNTIAIIVYDK
jgi:hypothetical protein